MFKAYDLFLESKIAELGLISMKDVNQTDLWLLRLFKTIHYIRKNYSKQDIFFTFHFIVFSQKDIV